MFPLALIIRTPQALPVGFVALESFDDYTFVVPLGLPDSRDVHQAIAKATQAGLTVLAYEFRSPRGSWISKPHRDGVEPGV